MEDHLLLYLLHLADSSLILGHRNSEWTGHGPVLEQDIALSNIALDQVGQARNFYQYAAKLKGNGATEDSLAYLRGERDFRNWLLTEVSNGDWAKTILRQFFAGTCQFFLYQRLQYSADPLIAAVSAKALKEVTYHMRWSGEWVIRLGDGTEESHARMNNALADLWMFTGELTIPAPYELFLSGKNIAVDPALIKGEWMEKITAVFNEAGLAVPGDTWMQEGGKTGIHTEHLGYILAEMQFLQRAYPGNEW
jgi:ring-1,2-phenylacetyl-CoA epoxidase subunit PaaC